MNTNAATNDKRIMTEEQMAMIAAGCWLGGRFGTHHLIPYEGFALFAPDGNVIQYRKSQCKDCKKFYYIAQIGSSVEEITEGEYRRAKMLRV